MEWIWFAVAGLAAGVLSGMGMGGGTVLIPMLTLILGVEQHAAQGINMLAFLPGALLAIYVHWRGGMIDKEAGKSMVLWGAFGAVAGAFIATWLPTDWLKKAFGMFLIILAVYQWRKSAKKVRASNTSSRNLK